MPPYSCELNNRTSVDKPVALIETWQLTRGFPPEVSAIFTRSPLASLTDMQITVSIPDYIVSCPKGALQSRHDLFVLGRSGGELSAITVEGEEEETFGPTIAEWKQSGSHKAKCLSALHNLLSLDEEASTNVSYRLLFLAAATVVGCGLFSARNAVFLIHSFCRTNQCFSEFGRFLSLFGKDGKKDELIFLQEVDDIRLYAGWVTGERKHLQ